MLFRSGLGAHGWLSSSYISRLRNLALANGPTVRHLAALAALNRICWTWDTKGEASAIKTAGPYSNWGITLPMLRQSIWLPIPDDEGNPLEEGEWMLLALGRLELPYLGPGLLSPKQSQVMSKALGDLLHHLLEAQGLPFRDAMAKVMAAYPVSNTRRQQRLQDLILGKQLLSSADVEEEVMALSQLVGQLRGRTVSPSELLDELTGSPKSSG